MPGLAFFMYPDSRSKPAVVFIILILNFIFNLHRFQEQGYISSSFQGTGIKLAQIVAICPDTSHRKEEIRFIFLTWVKVLQALKICS
jgi:hypothetical protein